MKVIVVGAGIAGLAAAWELARVGVGDVTVLESERRAGGVIVTEHVQEFIVEGGPDGFLAGEPELPALATELGIADRLVNQQARGTALWNGKELAPLDEGRAAALLGIAATKADIAACWIHSETCFSPPNCLRQSQSQNSTTNLPLRGGRKTLFAFFGRG